MKTSKRSTTLILYLVLISTAAIKVDFLYGQNYNLITDSIQMFWPSAPLDKPGYLETVITGKYIVLNGYISGGDDQTQIYDINGNKIGLLWSEYGRPSHYDLTVDENGDEVAVGVSKSSPDNGHVIKRRLNDGAVTVLTYGGYATHTSTRCPGRPGWAISSFSHRGPSNWEPYYNEIAAVKLDGSRVERICHIRGLYKPYDNEA